MSLTHLTYVSLFFPPSKGPTFPWGLCFDKRFSAVLRLCKCHSDQTRVCPVTLKVIELLPEGRALQQIKDKGYADKYRSRSEPIHLIGVEFSKMERNITCFEIETLNLG